MAVTLERESPTDALTVDLLRTMFRGLRLWRENVGLLGLRTTTLMYEGVEWDLLDIERIYEASQTLLTPRQAQAIHYFLVMNLREADVAHLMGIKPTNPIGMYATDGLNVLIQMIRDGRLSA